MSLTFKTRLIFSVLLLGACSLPSAPLNTHTGQYPELTGIKPWELIAEVHDTRFEQVARRRLGASVIDRFNFKGRQFILLRLDPQKVQAQPYELKDRSVNSLTLAAVQDLASHHDAMIEGLELNTLAELPQVSSPSPTPVATPVPAFNDLLFDLGGGLEGWWRTETQVEGAWNFSIGTGVTAAYLDLGFVRGHPELERRLVLNGKNNQTRDYLDKEPGNIEVPSGDHGTASLLVGFAERGNRLPSVGVAPNAKVAPYVAETVWDASRALYAAYQTRPDVIGMNFAFPLYPKWQAYGEYRQYQLLKDVFAEIARDNKIPVVVPAHNYGEPVRGGPRDWIPVAWASEYDNVIGVGGVQAKREKGQTQLKAWFSPDLLTGINARGSNHGEGLIWAPSTGLDIANPRPNGLTPGSMSGTSAGCPFITAALTVLRSRVPELPPKQLREILLATSRAIPADELLERVGATVPMIQLEAALKSALTAAGKNPDDYRARSFSGQLSFNGKNHELTTPQARYELLPTLAGIDGPNPSALTGQTVNVRGWSGLPGIKAGALEVLSLSAANP